jgi:hypothetical protein
MREEPVDETYLRDRPRQLRLGTVIRYRVDSPRQYRRFTSQPDHYRLLLFSMQGGHKMGHSLFGWGKYFVYVAASSRQEAFEP